MPFHEEQISLEFLSVLMPEAEVSEPWFLLQLGSLPSFLQPFQGGLTTEVWPGDIFCSNNVPTWLKSLAAIERYTISEVMGLLSLALDLRGSWMKGLACFELVKVSLPFKHTP